jgi:hypothetical protein
MKKLVIGALFLLMALPTYALYSSDYEDYTVGNPIATESSAWWNPSSTGIVAVDPLDSENQVVDMSGGASTVWYEGYGVNTLADQFVNVDFDLYISDTTVRTLTYAETDYDTSDVIYNAWGRSGAGTIDYLSGGAWATASAPTVDATWMHVRYELDQVNDTYSLILDGTVVLNSVACNPQPSQTINTSTWDVGTGTVLIDNMAVTSVPEPTTCILLGLGGLLLRRKRK